MSPASHALFDSLALPEVVTELTISRRNRTDVPEVAVLIFEDCQPSAVATVLEALSVANLHWTIANGGGTPPFSYRTIPYDGRPVRGMGDVTLAADGSLKDLGRPDLIFVPGIRAYSRPTMEQRLQQLKANWGDELKAHYRRNGYLAANCSGIFLLAEAGLLDRRTATTSWWLARSFRSRYPRVRLVPEMLVTKDSRIFCAASFSACLNLGLEIVSEFLGPRAMLGLARVLLIDINRTTQLPYANLQQQVQHGDDLVMRAQALLLSRLRRPSDLERLAKRLHVTSRTLHRRFRAATGESPLVFLQNARIERAKRLLEITNISFDQIAHRVGYDDVSSFRRLFTRSSGISPGSYRQKFGLRKSKNAPTQ
jgi:transcriptional regulator GlxA family with amidase domain